MVSQHWFPPEIWTVVFQMISKDYHYDIMNVRLTCKIFENLATPFLLLPRIICAPSSSSLTTLTAVSRHPVLSRSVREVVYVCNRFHSIKTLPEFKEAVRRAYPFDEFDEPKSEEENLGLNTCNPSSSRPSDGDTVLGSFMGKGKVTDIGRKAGLEILASAAAADPGQSKRPKRRAEEGVEEAIEKGIEQGIEQGIEEVSKG